MKKMILIFAFFVLSFWAFSASTSGEHDDHGHPEKEASHAGEKTEPALDEHGHDHQAEERHSEEEKGHEEEGHDDHGDHEEEEASSVGPDKGITEKAEAGFKLAPEALKTMGIVTKEFAGGQTQLPLKAIVSIKAEKTVFRVRNGWFKRVKFENLQRSAEMAVISSNSFRLGDQIVLEGVGFLRIAEIYAEEGASHSHAH